MRSITATQLSVVLRHELVNKPFTEGVFTFSMIQPWSPEAWEAEALVEEVVLAGYDFASPILTKTHVLDPKNEVDMVNTDVNVYKQFAFPNQTSGNISHNARTWLEEFRSASAKPSVKLLGNLLDILEEKIPEDSFVVVNTFVIHRIEKETTFKELFDATNILAGDIVRVYKFNEHNLDTLYPPFLLQRCRWNSIYALFEVK